MCRARFVRRDPRSATIEGMNPGPARAAALVRGGDLRLDLAEVPPADRTAQPDGFVVLTSTGDRIHFLDWGAPASDREEPGVRPGLVLVHGLSGTAWIWAPVARRLRSAMRVVAVDLQGHGLSDAPTAAAAYAPDALIETVVAVAEGARLLEIPGLGAPSRAASGPPAHVDGPGRRVVLAGHGFGGSVAALAAARLGSRCAGLVLVDGGWEALRETTGMEPEEFLRSTEEPPEVLRSLVAWLADRAAFDPATWDADQERAAREAVVELPVGRVVATTRPHALEAAVRAAFAFEPRDTLSAVEAPIVALAAADDEDGSHAAALAATQAALGAAGRPAIRVARFPSAGHNLMRYRPAEVAAAILQLADRTLPG